MATKSSTTSYSERDLEMLRIMHRCLKSKPDVDMEKFAAETGLGGVKSARATLHRLLKKLSGEDESAADAASPAKEAEGEETPQATPAGGKKKGGSRKRKTETADGDEADSPSKKKASPTKRKTKVKAEDEGEGDQEAA